MGEENRLKKMALGLLLVFVTAALIGCHTPKPVREEALQPMVQSYRGVLPCADCAGIDTSLSWQKTARLYCNITIKPIALAIACLRPMGNGRARRIR